MREVDLHGRDPSRADVQVAHDRLEARPCDLHPMVARRQLKPSQVDAALKNGQTMSVSVEQRRGSVDHPLSVAEAAQKFRRLAAASLLEPEVDEVIELVQRIEREPGVERLMSLLTRSARKS